MSEIVCLLKMFYIIFYTVSSKSNLSCVLPEVNKEVMSAVKYLLIRENRSEVSDTIDDLDKLRAWNISKCHCSGIVAMRGKLSFVT